ncbi:beta-lactamase family protein [bacterium]|nr:beta-lactamase family protein [bacterium]
MSSTPKYSDITCLRALLFLILLGVLPFAKAQNLWPSGASTDPAKMDWMQGTPPAAEQQVRHKDMSFYQFPRTRWTFSNFRQLMPTVSLWRGPGEVSTLPARPLEDIAAVLFTPMGSDKTMTWQEMLGVTYADAALVLHRGQVVYESYFGVTEAHTPHISFSMTKSYYGTLAAILISEGALNETKRVSDYLPELANSGFADATVREILDMTTAIDYSEDYRDPNAHVFAFARAGGIFPQLDNYEGPEGFYAYVETLGKEGEHGEVFSYRSVNTEVLGWLIARVSGKNAVAVLQERIWSRLGAEQDAYMLVDSLGTGWAAGGLNATLRDQARFGEMMRLNGKWQGEQIVPSSVVEAIRAGGDPAKFALAGYKTLPGASYRDQWWVHHNQNGAFSARGVHGQTIYIDPAAEMVIVRLASHPLAANGNYDGVSLPAYQAVAEFLMGRE